MKRIIGLMLVMCVFLSIGVVFPQDTNGEGVENLWEIAGFENDGDLEVEGLKESTEHDQDDKITVSVNASGNVKYKHGEEKEKREFKNIEEGSNFTFENGKLVEANFKTKGDEATKYKLGNYEYTIPPGSQVTYKIGKKNEKDTVIIIQPAGTETKPPEIIDSSLKKEVEVEIKTDEEGFLKISQGNIGAVEESGERYKQKETSLFYGPGRKDEIRMYTKEKYTTFFTKDNKPEFTIINPKKDGELDLVFDNNKVNAKRSSVLVTENEIGSINLEGEGAIISIASDNRLGIGKDQLEAGKKTLSYQGKNGYAVLEKGLGGDNPLIKLQGESLYGPDSRVFLGDADRKEFYYKPGQVIKGVKNGDGAIAINAKLYDKDNNPLPYVILTTNENVHNLAPEKDLKGPEKYIVGPDGVVYSANAAFNQLTPESRKELIQLGAGERAYFLNELKNGGNVAGIQANINKILLQSNPLRSSVALGGCSGTLIGYSREGSPMVLTAAHCVREGGSRNVWLNNLNDGSKADRGVRGIYAEVVAYSGRGYRSYETKDLALMKLHPNDEQLKQIKKRGFARISPRKDFVQVDDKVTMIGCPVSTFYSRSCNVLRIDQTTGTDSLRTDLEPYKGQSGGGLFKGRHLVGVVQSWRDGRARGGFGNLQSIYKLLDDSGYSYLYEIFFVFVFK